MSRKCLNSRDTFCYICGEFTVKSQRRFMTGLVKKAYELYFSCKIGDQDKAWAPHICCARCAVYLRPWLRDTPKAMPFAVPMHGLARTERSRDRLLFLPHQCFWLL